MQLTLLVRTAISRVHAQRFHPGDVLFDDGGVRAVVAASYGLHIFGLKERPSDAGLKRDAVGAEPGLILHHDYVAFLVTTSGAAGSRGGASMIEDAEEVDCAGKQGAWATKNADSAAAASKKRVPEFSLCRCM